MAKKSKAQILRMQRRAAERGETYIPSVQESNSVENLTSDDRNEKKLSAARKLANELLKIELNKDLKAKDRRFLKRKAEAIAFEEASFPAEELLSWYKEYGESDRKPDIPNFEEDKISDKKQQSTRSNPCILFVGQLSYETTKDELFQHIKQELGKDFSITEESVRIRLLTDAKTNKSRGMAFVETTDPELLYACLKLHHTTLNGRRINVERSAGGKKNSTTRKEKIKQYREEQGKYISDAVDNMIAEFVESGELRKEELDEGAVGLCKRHSASTVEGALTRYIETNGRDMDNPSAYFMSLIGKIATEGVFDGSIWGKKSNSTCKRNNTKKEQGERSVNRKRPHDDSRKNSSSVGDIISKFSKSDIDMSISGEKRKSIFKVYPSMKRGRGRSGRGYM